MDVAARQRERLFGLALDAVQCLRHRVLGIAGRHHQRQSVGATLPGLQAVVGGMGHTVFAQVQRTAPLHQLLCGFGRQHEEFVTLCAQPGSSGAGACVFLERDVVVGATESERADGGAARVGCIANPGA